MCVYIYETRSSVYYSYIKSSQVQQTTQACMYIYIYMNEISTWATENTGEGIRRTKYLKLQSIIIN